MKKANSLRVLALGVLLVCPRASFAAVEAAAEDASLDYSTESEIEIDDGGDGISSPELLILSPLLNGVPLNKGPSLSILALGSTTYLPLFQISNLFEIGIRPANKGNTAQGFFVSERRIFHLNALTGEIHSGDLHTRISPSLLIVKRDEIYVPAELLSRWLPIDFEVQRFASTLNMKPREQTPLQIRLAREDRLKMLGFGPQAAQYPRMSTPYKLLDGPFIDQTLSAYGSRSNGIPSTGFGYSTYAAADLLYLETNGYVAGTREDPLGYYRAKAGRKDYYGRLFGPLRATQFDMGYIYANSVPLVLPNDQLIGASVASYPLNRINEIEGNTFRGELPAGWVVELYQDDLLLDYRRSNITGTYSFDNILMRGGVNKFTLLFYGPNGQVREETHTLNLADTLAAQGAFYYGLAAGQNVNGNTTGTLTAEYGLLPTFTLLAGLASLRPQLENPTRQYTLIGAKTVLGPVFARVDLAGSSQGGAAWQGTVQSRVAIVNLAAEYQSIGEAFSSQYYYPGPGKLERRIAIRTDTAFMPVAHHPLGLFLDADRSFYNDQTDISRIQLREASSLEEVGVVHHNTWSISQPDAYRQLKGGLNVSRRVDPRGFVRFAGDFNYDLVPESTPRSFSVGLNGTFSRTYSWSGTFHREFRAGNSLDASLGKTFEAFTTTLSASYYQPAVYTGFVSLSFSVGYIRAHDEVRFDDQNLALSGTILVRTFIDDNQNGLWDAGEKPAANTSISLNGTTLRNPTGPDGTLLLSSLPAYVPAQIAATGFDDPTVISSVAGYSVVPRPGRVMVLEFPLLMTGEIDGTVYLNDGNQPVEAASVPVEVIDANGRQVKVLYTAFDGYYLFERLPTGKYTVRILPSYLDLTFVSLPRSKSVVIDSNEPDSNGNDFIIRSR